MRRLKAGAWLVGGSLTGVSVIGTRAKENRIETRAKGMKPSLSPTKISNCPSAKARLLTAMYMAKTRPRSWLCATIASQLSTTR